jgi:bacillithiol synthase
MPVARVDRVPYSVAGFGNALTHDLVRGAQRALDIFAPPAPAALAAQIIERKYPREELASVLLQCARENSAHDAALKNIELLRDPRTLVVATGQQAGFLGGPLYSLHKALSAIVEARALSDQLKCPVVPLFWVAADDHDQGEIDHAYMLKASGELARLRAECDPATFGCSAADLRLNPASESQAALLQKLSEVLGDENCSREIVRLYSELGFGRAFTRLFYRWLGSLGLVLAPSDLMRPFAKEILLRDLGEFETVARLIQSSGEKMKGAGYEPGFSASLRTAPHFFIATEPHTIRARLEPLSDGSFEEQSVAFSKHGIAGKKYRRIDLAKLLDEHPERFSSSAAVRPVVQQAILPVISVVLGPGEVSYWAQLRDVHSHFGIPWPRIVVRASMTLLDAAGAKAARKLNVATDSPDLFLAEEAMGKKLTTNQELKEKVKSHADKVLGDFDAMHAEIRAVEGGLDPMFEKTRERFASELERISHKTLAASSQREGATLSRIKYLATLVRPKNQLQERVLSVGSFLCRMPELPAELLPHIPVSASEHLVITLE